MELFKTQQRILGHDDSLSEALGEAEKRLPDKKFLRKYHVANREWLSSVGRRGSVRVHAGPCKRYLTLWVGVHGFAGVVGTFSHETPAPQAAPAHGGPLHYSHHALVIGNAAYRTMPKLGASRKGAALVARLFKACSYTVTDVADVSLGDLKRVVDTFVGALSPGCTVVVFFSGHGSTREGVSYLAPTDGSTKDVEGAASMRARLHNSMVECGCHETFPRCCYCC